MLARMLLLLTLFTGCEYKRVSCEGTVEIRVMKFVPIHANGKLEMEK